MLTKSNPNSKNLSFATALIITAAILEGLVTKDRFKRKSVKHYQNWGSVTRKQCTTMKKGIACGY